MKRLLPLLLALVLAITAIVPAYATGDGNFDDKIFISGFFSNALLAAFLVYIGDHMGIDLYYVALLALGLRIFNNLGRIRQHLLKKH